MGLLSTPPKKYGVKIEPTKTEAGESGLPNPEIGFSALPPLASGGFLGARSDD